MPRCSSYRNITPGRSIGTSAWNTRVSLCPGLFPKAFPTIRNPITGHPYRGPPHVLRVVRGKIFSAGEYGGRDVRIWDTGTFELEKWSPTEVMVVLHGSRVSGRYVLFATNGKNWTIHRMDPAPPNFEPIPKRMSPMLATAGKLPLDDTGWAYEIKWDGVRGSPSSMVAGSGCRAGTTMSFRIRSRSFVNGAFLGTRRCVIDGEYDRVG